MHDDQFGFSDKRNRQRAWAKANSLAEEKSEGWKIDLTNGLVSMSSINLTQNLSPSPMPRK
jgi:hypothetical protein